MDELKIKNMSELYELLLPALKFKENKLKKKHFSYIKTLDIFNYLKKIWQNKNNLTLYDLVNDVLLVDELAIINNLCPTIDRGNYLEEYL